MRKHWLYFRFVARHKWFVLLEGLKLWVPIWCLILHDWDKFTPVEWFAYKRRFDNGNDFTQMVNDEPYHMAYHMHMRRNKHHWQWWVTMRDGGKTRVLPIDETSRREFLADMRGMGRTIDKPNIGPWYLKNRDMMILHPETREWIEMMLGVCDAA